MSNIEYRDNSPQVLSALKQAIHNGLTAIGMKAESYAKKLTPVDTGRLRNSITFAIAGEEPHVASYSDNKKNHYAYNGVAPGKKGKAVYIGSNVEYAPYVELGARGRAGVHMLKRAATDHKDEYKELMEKAMKNA